jgi:hypothetical protein
MMPRPGNVVAQAAEKPVLRGDIDWKIRRRASSHLAEYRDAVGEASYMAQRRSLQEWLCLYFNGRTGCESKWGNISPICSTKDGGKALKVRWAGPACGKSGGLRLAIVAYCNIRRVDVAGAWMRKEDPDSDEFADVIGV